MPFRLFPGRSSRGVLRRRVPRSLVAVLLGLQALLWGGGSIIEARAAAESLSRYSHVEDQGTSTCPPMHSHLNCVVCRTFASGALTARQRELLPAAPQASLVPDAPGILVRSDRCAGQVGSRAPPGLAHAASPIA